MVSATFQGLNSLRRHRAVNAALREEIARLHAWSVSCKTPEEWTAERGASATTADAPAAAVEPEPDARAPPAIDRAAESGAATDGKGDQEAAASV